MARLVTCAILPGLLAATLFGCGAAGTTEDSVSTAPPITEQSGADLTKEINAQSGGIQKAPGVGRNK